MSGCLKHFHPLRFLTGVCKNLGYYFHMHATCFIHRCTNVRMKTEKLILELVSGVPSLKLVSITTLAE
jgi:hypothetical protein